MATQPNNYMTANSSVDFDQMVFDGTVHYHAQDGLTLSRENGILNTPELERGSPLGSSGSDVNVSNGGSARELGEHSSMNIDEETSFASEAEDEKIVALILDIEVNENDAHHNSDRRAATNQQATIETIADELRNAAEEASDRMDLQTVVTAIKRHPHPMMRMRVQPVARQRFRYRIDGRRHLKNSKRRPMSIRVLPRLTHCLTKPSQSFWIQATLVTTRHNPRGKVYRHQHRMKYNGENARCNGSNSFRIPVTNEEIRRRIKVFRYASIIKTKLQDYSFELVPFDPLIIDDHADHYTVDDEEQLTQVQKSKRFDTEYHTEDFRIVFQLLIRQNDLWHTTDLYCETRIITDA